MREEKREQWGEEETKELQQVKNKRDDDVLFVHE